jgi:hypothetical protein
LFLVPVLAALSMAPPARAQSSAEDRAAADALYEEAGKLMQAKRWAEACPKLEASLKLDPGIGTSLRLGFCYEQLGRTASAWSAYNDAEAMARKAGDKRADEAARHAKEVEHLLSRLQLDVAPENRGGGVEIRRDGKTIDPAAWASAIPIDPGTHVIEASGPGRQPWKMTVTIETKAGTTTIRIPVLERAIEETAKATEADAPKRGKIVLEAAAGVGLAPTLGGDVAGGCTGGCKASVPLGGFVQLRGGYELPAGIFVGASVGYLTLATRFGGRASTLMPVGKPASTGTVDDSVGVRGLLLGVAGGYRFGDRLSGFVGLGAGALLGSAHDERAGSFHSSGGAAYAAGPIDDREAARFLFLAPEASIGIRLPAHLELSLGLRALALFTVTRPAWDASVTVVGSDGLASWNAETLTGKAILVLVPAVALGGAL